MTQRHNICCPICGVKVACSSHGIMQGGECQECRVALGVSGVTVDDTLVGLRNVSLQWRLGMVLIYLAGFLFDEGLTHAFH